MPELDDGAGRDRNIDVDRFGSGAVDFADRYHRQRDQLAGLARHLQDAADRLPDTAGTGVITEWGRSILRLRDALVRQVTAGLFTPRNPGWGAPTDTDAGDPRTTVLPVLDICAHLACNRLGISVTEESYLRYLVTRTVAELAEEES